VDGWADAARGAQARGAREGLSLALLEQAIALLRHRKLSVLTGAGISTESGIPDYRGPETKRRARNPIRFQEYLKSDETRARYWARSMVGWERFSKASPNIGHHALARLEAAERLTGLITQNVDRLHQRADHHDVIELHGALAEVRCLQCGTLESRDALQRRLRALNPTLLERSAELAPDGDSDLSEDALRGVRIASCLQCAGALKPNVVFFGENVAPGIVEDAYARVEKSDALLVVGSSLTVFSGYRFVRRAESLGLPIVILNLGPTRGDPHATLTLDSPAGETLDALVQALL